MAPISRVTDRVVGHRPRLGARLLRGSLPRTGTPSWARRGWQRWNQRGERALERLFTGSLGLDSDAAAFAAYAGHMTTRLCALFALACVGLNLLFWISDAVVFAQDRSRWLTFTTWRIGFLATSLFGVFAFRDRALGDRAPFATGASMLLGHVAFTYTMFSQMGGPEQPWLHTCLAVPLTSVLLLVPLLERIALVMAVTTTLFLAYFVPHPEYLAHPFVGAVIGMTVGASLLAIVAGHGFYFLLRRGFEQRRELTRLAYTDTLTGIPNRARFLDLARQEVERAKRYGRSLSLLILDVDHFKRINDQHGHLGGDAVLRALGRALRETVRVSDLLGRLGGEEFGVVLPETDGAQAARLADRLRESCAGVGVPVTGGSVRCTLTVGGTELHPTTDEGLRELLIRADGALYAGKNAGRDRVVMG